MTVTRIAVLLSYTFDGESQSEAINLINKMLANIESNPAKSVEQPATAEPAKVKVAKPKKILTEEEKAVIRARFAAGKAKAAQARGEVAPVPETVSKPEPKSDNLKGHAPDSPEVKAAFEKRSAAKSNTFKDKVVGMEVKKDKAPAAAK